MAAPKTTTYTQSFTKARIDVLEDHFELFLRCAGHNDSQIDKLLSAVENQELNAVGAYIEEDGYRIAEVEFEVDWNKHNQLVRVAGELFDTDQPGWNNGIAVEPYVAVARLSKLAKAKNLSIRSWIRVEKHIRDNPTIHKQVCDKLGYSFGSSVSPWKQDPQEHKRSVYGLEEASLTIRKAR